MPVGEVETGLDGRNYNSHQTFSLFEFLILVILIPAG